MRRLLLVLMWSARVMSERRLWLLLLRRQGPTIVMGLGWGGKLAVR